MSRRPSPAAGFTLVEMIVVIVLIGIVGGMIMMAFRPALQSYQSVTRRASLSNQADTALRRMVAEVRSAVPNSLRLAEDSRCVEILPTSDGGRFRTGPDITRDVAGNVPTAFVDFGQGVSELDVLTRLDASTGAGDSIVVGNQDPTEVYGGINRARIRSAVPSPATAALPGEMRITLESAAPVQFPQGTDSGRFVIVPGGTDAVTYRCEGVGRAGPDRQQTGTGTLFRYRNYGINANQRCDLAANARQIVATRVADCTFFYDPNQGAIQQSGYLQVHLTLLEGGEQVNLVYSAHVNNVP